MTNNTEITLDSILAEFRDLASSNREMGDAFERLMVAFLRADPIYKDRFDEVWLWSEWPHRFGAGQDVGIDIVARESLTGDFCAIQCKFYLPDHSIQKADIDSFFTASGKRFPTPQGNKSFSSRIIVSTTDKWSKHAENALADQTIPCTRLRVEDLAESPIDWASYCAGLSKLNVQPPKELREHQQSALEETLNGFTRHDRGKLIMACGTGKTFTALKIMEDQTPDHGLVLFLVPSISLLSQTLREWAMGVTSPFHAFAVCSDTKIGKEQEDMSTHDLAYPATTDAKKLALHAAMAAKDRRTVIFSTYQSIQVVADAQRGGLGEFDLVICDEAHRTTGITRDKDDASDFTKVHENHVIRAKKRLYMTATPRIFNDASKKKADDKNAVLYSMDDPELYGPVFYRIGFDEAVRRGILTDYKVLIVTVDEEAMAHVANEANDAFKLDEKLAIDTKLAVRIIGAWKGLAKHQLKVVQGDGEIGPLTEDTNPMRRAVAFSRSIKASQQITEIFSKVVGLFVSKHEDDDLDVITCDLDHVDGGMNALQRATALNWLRDGGREDECRILSNARCLSEGVDVPSLDSVIFFDTRESMVDIVQSVGRVMRRAQGKQYGYIILPVGIPSKEIQDYNSYIEKDGQFKSIWKIIKALRAHDESLVDEAEFRKKVTVATVSTGGGGTGGGGDQEEIDFPELPVDAISEAVYASIPAKLGDREYWSNWAKDIGNVAERLIERIKAVIADDAEFAKEFGTFLKGLQDTLNPAVSAEEAIEMLAQHILTLPVFKALFAGSEFPANNAVAKALQVVVDKLDAAAVASETEGLENFYENVRDRVKLAKSDKSKQDIIRNLYDTFFHNAFPRMAERLGIVYTPVEVVDFILQSADYVLKKHFQCSLADQGVQILDPFSGTGTFLVRLIQSGLIDKESLPFKFLHEMHANEIVLLAYYIATVNMETAFHGQTGQYKPFNGMVLIDTFQMTEKDDLVDEVVLPENNERATRQLAQPIRVIVGNPPYSAQQDSENDNNKNITYPDLDDKIRRTYAAKSDAKLKKNLYDSYIRAIRWATDRVGENGIVAYVTNGSFLESNNMDGVRKALGEDFSHLYIVNLRGNARTQGEERRKEGGGVFDAGSRTPVAITLMVKDPNHKGPCELHYYDIGDYLTREDKLRSLNDFSSVASVPWTKLKPNAAGDWINQRDPAFDAFLPAGDKDDKRGHTVFGMYSQGILTSRDAWTYSYSKNQLGVDVRRLIDKYSSELKRFQSAVSGIDDKQQWPDVADVVDADPKDISWSRALKADVRKGKALSFEDGSVVLGVYRPFSRQWVYFSRRLNEMVYKMPALFPTADHENVVLFSTGTGASKDFSCLATNVLPNYHFHDSGQCFPLYWYEKASGSDDEADSDLFGQNAESDEHGYIRHDAITDWALKQFHTAYGDTSITKEDIFWYVYGILHSAEYKGRFASDLKKMLPRIPLAGDFWAFSKAGRELGNLHLGYETVEPWPVTEEKKDMMYDDADWRVEKMSFGKLSGRDRDKSIIHYNPKLTLRDIPLEAYEYIVNGKSAIEWVMERYAISVDKKSGIRNDPNDWCTEHNDPQYIVNLLKRVIRISVESVHIVNGLPPLNERR